MSEMVERVARALMKVTAAMPGNALDGKEVPVLSLDPDYDDLPIDASEGTENDEITREGVLRLARAAIEAMREPTDEQRMAYHVLSFRTECFMDAIWERSIDAALRGYPEAPLDTPSEITPNQSSS